MTSMASLSILHLLDPSGDNKLLSCVSPAIQYLIPKARTGGVTTNNTSIEATQKASGDVFRLQASLSLSLSQRLAANLGARTSAHSLP